MNCYNASSARANLFSLISDVNKNHIPVHIVSKNGDAVLLSKSDWNAIEETLYLMSVPGMEQSIIDGLNTGIDELLPESELAWNK